MQPFKTENKEKRRKWLQLQSALISLFHSPTPPQSAARSSSSRSPVLLLGLWHLLSGTGHGDCKCSPSRFQKANNPQTNLCPPIGRTGRRLGGRAHSLHKNGLKGYVWPRLGLLPCGRRDALLTHSLESRHDAFEFAAQILNPI
jgi:hypothetical protein